MRIHFRYLIPLAAAGATSVIVLAPQVAAVPDCVATEPNTTLCQRPGHSSLTTSPPANNFNPYPFGYGIGFNPGNIFGGW